MISLIKSFIFLFFLISNFLLCELHRGRRRSIFVIVSFNFVLVFSTYLIMGFDLLSGFFSLVLFVTYALMLYRKYVEPQERMDRKIAELSSNLDEKEDVAKKLQHISEISVGDEMLDQGVLRFIREVANLMLSERRKFQRMQDMFMLLTNFARYSFSEQDKEKLIKELDNMVSYAFPDKKFWVIKRKDVQVSQSFAPHLDDEDISNIRMGKLEGKKYTAFPIMENGSAFAYIILKNEDVGDYEKFFLYLVSKFSESVIKRIDREKEIELRAITDPLTNIYNRRYLIQHLEQSFAKFKRLGTTYTLIIFDIDCFKKINDTYGHYIGDMILVEFASILKSNVRAYDIPARFGGDEFVLFLDGATKEDSINVARRMAKKFSEFSSSKDMLKEKVSVSWGLANVQEASSHFEDIIKLADRRLIKAKLLGKGKGVWE